MNQGTPKTLEEAIAAGNADMRARIRDYLSQKFGVYMLTDDEATLKALQGLWASITGETLSGGDE